MPETMKSSTVRSLFTWFHINTTWKFTSLFEFAW